MRNKILVLFFALLLPIFLVSCKGLKGADGDAGGSGPTGLTMLSFQDGVFPSDAYAGTQDSDLISGANADSNYGTGGVNTVGFTGSIYRPIIKFDVSTVVPSNVTVVEAYLIVTLNGTMANTVSAYAVTAAWDETQVTWNSRMTATPWATPGGDKGALQDSKVCGTATLTFSLSPILVSSWITSPSTNYGLLLQATDESSGAWRNVLSREYGTATSRPKLVIYYRLP